MPKELSQGARPDIYLFAKQLEDPQHWQNEESIAMSFPRPHPGKCSRVIPESSGLVSHNCISTWLDVDDILSGPPSGYCFRVGQETVNHSLSRFRSWS